MIVAGAFLIAALSTSWNQAADVVSAQEGPSVRPVSAHKDTIATYCVTCHSDRRKTGGLSLSAFEPDEPLADRDTAEKVIRKLRAGMMPPPGATRPGAVALDSLADSLERIIDAAAAASPDPGWRPFQRLNRAEYRQAILDLVGVEVAVEGLLPADTISAGFDNVADVQTFSPIVVTRYLRAASQVSALAVASPTNRKVFVCWPDGVKDETACADRILTALVAKAYRGTATKEDIADARQFYVRGRTGGDFRDGIRLALQSILVSPRFVFKLEAVPPHAAPTPTRRLSGAALASRLSFFLWGRPPDPTLIAAAERGLQTDEALESQARRMLADPRAAALSSRFARQWLRLQDLESVKPDATRFPGFDDALVASMVRETELLFEDIVRADRSVLDLLESDHSFVDRRLARHYGLPPVPGAGFVKVRVGEERRGILGHASVLMATSLSERTSPVLRGKWVMEVLLGTPPPPPPPNVPALDDSVSAERGGVRLSTRQRVEEHRKNPQCASCHRFIDPLGLTLENFDVTGVWRTADNSVPIDSHGDLYDGTVMAGPSGLRRALLGKQTMVLRSFTENLLTYALGRRLTANDMPVVRAIVADAAKNNYRLSAFVRGVVTSPPFTTTNAER